MRSKTSKRSRPSPSLWKAARGCDESTLSLIATALAGELKPGHRLLLSGEMGAGKSTFARALRLALGAQGHAEGSPTFAVGHEFRLPLERGGGVFYHLDLYRIRDADEFEQTGLDATLGDRSCIIALEWANQIEGLESQVERSGPTWRVQLDLESETLRTLEIRRLT